MGRSYMMGKLCACAVIVVVLATDIAMGTQQTVSLKFKNTFTNDKFVFKLNIDYTAYTSAFTYMQIGSNENPGLLKNFTCTYYPSVGGFFINAINGVEGNFAVDGTYWKLYINNVASGVGVVDILPDPGDTVLFEFVQTPGGH